MKKEIEWRFYYEDLESKNWFKKKTSLRQSSGLSGSKPIKRGKRNKRSLLVDKADAVFGHYIRLRDSVLVGDKWIGECVDGCGKAIVNRYYDGEKWRWTKSGNVGHFHSRGFRDLRYDEYNCNLQSSYCNAWRDKESMQAGYRKGLRAKYGDAVLKELKSKAEAKGYPTTVQKWVRDRGLHPTQKPLEMFEWLIRTYSDEGDLVVDPFAGSGTTLLAAQNLNREYLGAEKLEKYRTTIIKRLTTKQESKEDKNG